MAGEGGVWWRKEALPSGSWVLLLRRLYFWKTNRHLCFPEAQSAGKGCEGPLPSAHRRSVSGGEPAARLASTLRGVGREIRSAHVLVDRLGKEVRRRVVGIGADPVAHRAARLAQPGQGAVLAREQTQDLRVARVGVARVHEPLARELVVPGADRV